ncbi:MAG: YHYH protein [Anaerolineae bacterium]|nr:YHYH protein [Anaerolineae bacterium]
MKIFWALFCVAIFFTHVSASPVSAHDVEEYDDYTYINETTGTMVHIYVEDGIRYFEANAIPDHETGNFPNAGNPNHISAQNLRLSAPAEPKIASTPTTVGLGKFGLAINGVPFERAAAEWYNDDPQSGWQYDAFGGGIQLGFDFNNAHVQPTGLYHYHGVPDVLLDGESLSAHPHLVGFAADGFPIYLRYSYENPSDPASEVVELQSSYQLKTGMRRGGPGGEYDGTFNEDWEYIAASGDLDQCNGRYGVTPEYPDGTYYYVLTENFPRVPMCWSGTPGQGWSGPGANGRSQTSTNTNDNRPDLAIAARELGITQQQLQQALGDPPPDFSAAAQRLGIPLQQLIDALQVARQ